jgi:hypothetical protein
MNLTEVPPLFYVVCVVRYVTATVGPLALGLAWLYVALRLAPGLIWATTTWCTALRCSPPATLWWWRWCSSWR